MTGFKVSLALTIFIYKLSHVTSIPYPGIIEKDDECKYKLDYGSNKENVSKNKTEMSGKIEYKTENVCDVEETDMRHSEGSSHETSTYENLSNNTQYSASNIFKDNDMSMDFKEKIKCCYKTWKNLDKTNETKVFSKGNAFCKQYSQVKEIDKSDESFMKNSNSNNYKEDYKSDSENKNKYTTETSQDTMATKTDVMEYECTSSYESSMTGAKVKGEEVDKKQSETSQVIAKNKPSDIPGSGGSDKCDKEVKGDNEEDENEKEKENIEDKRKGKEKEKEKVKEKDKDKDKGKEKGKGKGKGKGKEMDCKSKKEGDGKKEEN